MPATGTAFRISLPTVPIAQQAPEPAPSSARQLPVRSPSNRRLRVLVIDDEAAVAKTLARILEKDCDVAVQTDARAALRLLLLDDATPFDLIFCDLMMPKLSGNQLYAQVIAMRPKLASRFVFMTGGVFTGDARRFLSSIAAPVVDKPFDLAAVRRLLLAHHQTA